MNNAGHDTIKKGSLKKQGGIVKNWLDRWFVLRGKHLLYFTKEDEAKQQGTIELQGCKLVEIPFTRDEPDKWLFEISHVPRGGRSNETYLLWADSEAQRTEWMSALRRAVYRHIGGGVFGAPLTEVISYDKKYYGCDVPHVVKECVEIILENGKEVEGIFRLSGRQAQVKEMRRRYDEGERPNLAAEDLDIHTAASLLKLYFRELPEPVIPFQHFESFLNLATSLRYHSNYEQNINNLKSLVEVIPKENYKLLDYLTAFLYEISKYQHINKMTEKNIALIFGTNMLRALDNSPEFEMATQNLTTHVVLALVKWHDSVFAGAQVTSSPVDHKEVQQVVSHLDEPCNSPPATAQHSTVTVDDLLGIDFTEINSDAGKPPPPPIPVRTKDVSNGLDNVSSDSGLSKDTHSCSGTSLDSGRSLSITPPTPAPRSNSASETVRKRQGSTKHRNRPTGILQPDQPPSPTTKRKSGSLPLTKVERSQSNFTSYVDSPLNDRISLNIGDLPSSVDDLQALVLSLKLQLKEQKDTFEKLKQRKEELETRHRQQIGNLANTIHQERQAKDDALAKVVALMSQLAHYQSKYGMLDDMK